MDTVNSFVYRLYVCMCVCVCENTVGEKCVFGTLRKMRIKAKVHSRHRTFVIPDYGLRRYRSLREENEKIN